ncbi:hypothetical protein [Microbulbifer sp. TYP-18]|uniref:hypothetical protein n=1 Tax=Microbulbifer sp. TYP-18 TaxID=3230024 RepID=UPI0034C6B2A9
MSQQQPYRPDTNFSDLNRADPVSLDNELSGIASALSSTQDALRALLRDDGKLKDGLIELFMLATSVRNLLTTGINPRGNWDAGQGFGVGDLVNYGDDSFVCAATHVSGGDFDQDRETGVWVVFSRSLQLAIGVVLGSAAERDVGLGPDQVPDIDIADARYNRSGKGGLHHETAAGTQVVMPRGAANKYSGAFTGAIAIRFPQTWKNIHFRMILDVILEGTDQNQKAHSLSLMVSGKTDAAQQRWHDMQAHVLDGENPAQILPVRFGDGPDDHPVVWLGDLNTVWSNPSIKMRELFVAGAQTAAAYWVSGWSIDFVTAFDGNVSQQLRTAGISQLPDFSNSGGRYVRIRQDGTGLEYRTNFQVANDLQVPLEAPQDGEGYLRYNGGWLPISSYTFTIQNARVDGDFILDGGIGSATLTIKADSDQAGEEVPGIKLQWHGAEYEWLWYGAANGDLILGNVTGVYMVFHASGNITTEKALTAATLSGNSVKVQGKEVYHPENKPSIDDIQNLPKVTVSSSQPTGGKDGDVWFLV